MYLQACPDRWRQFDRIVNIFYSSTIRSFLFLFFKSTYEQSAFIHKPMLGCFQCGCIRHDGYVWIRLVIIT